MHRNLSQTNHPSGLPFIHPSTRGSLLNTHSSTCPPLPARGNRWHWALLRAIQLWGTGSVFAGVLPLHLSLCFLFPLHGSCWATDYTAPLESQPDAFPGRKSCASRNLIGKRNGLMLKYLPTMSTPSSPRPGALQRAAGDPRELCSSCTLISQTGSVLRCLASNAHRG